MTQSIRREEKASSSMEHESISQLLSLVDSKGESVIEFEEHSGSGVCFCTIQEANQKLDIVMRRDGSGDSIRSVARGIVSGSDITGSANDYHNIIQDFFRAGDYYAAKTVADKGLESFPYNVDLLANAIRASAYLADFESCQLYEATARSIGLQSWNWRLFVFLIDAYKCRLDVVGPDFDLRDEVYKKAHKIADEYLEHFPLDDRAYNAKAELYLLKNNLTEAKVVLDKAIADTNLLSPTCCVTYLDLLEPNDQGNCKIIVDTARKGISSTAEEQPSASIGYFLYREALALDAAISLKGKEGYENETAVKETLDCYECAYELLKGRRIAYQKTIEERYTILCSRGKGDFSNRSLAKDNALPSL